MKISLPIILTVFFASWLHAVSPTKDLNPELLTIFEKMLLEDKRPELEGRDFEVDLTVRIASGNFLIFSDAYLEADGTTKYQIGKWIFTPDQVASLKIKRGDLLAVKFRIEEIHTDPPYESIPHFTAKILSMTLAE